MGEHRETSLGPTRVGQSQAADRDTRQRRGSSHARRVVGRLVAVGTLTGLSLLASGCGGGTTPPGVAHLTTGATTTALSPQAAQMAMALRWAACMRAHGLPDFPDPTSVPGGGVHFDVPPAMATSATMAAAMQSCQKFQPPPTPPSGSQLAQLTTRLRAVAACMRHHGFPTFPDPNGEGAIDLAGTGIDKNSPALVAAGRICLRSAGIPLPALPVGAASSP